MKPLSKVDIPRLVASSFCAVCLISACVKQAPQETSPEGAKRFLKFRGYEFDNKAFFEAVNAGDPDLVTLFLTANIDPNEKDPGTGRTALILAAAHCHLGVVKALVKGKADINIKDNSGYTALFHAIEARHDEIASFLLAQPGLDLNARGKNGVTALISYVWRDNESVVRNLLERGADVNLQDADGDTALHGAAQNGNVDMTLQLLAKGAEVDAKNKLGGTPLMWAAVYGNDQVVKALLAHKAKPTLKDNEGMTALDWAIKNQRTKVIELLRNSDK
jgi:ankyrin repeat protein